MDAADKSKFEDALKRHRGGRPDLAEPVYRELAGRYPDDAEVLHLLGVVALQKGDPVSAVGHLLRALEAAPDHPKYLNTLGAAQLTAGDLGAAEEALAGAVAADPELADAHYNLGNALHGQGRHDEAERAYLEAIRLDPGNAEALNNLGGLLKENRRRQEAARFLRRAVAADPGDVGALLNLTDCLERLSLADEAAVSARRLLTLAPEHPIGSVLMARIERRGGDLAGALARLDGIEAADPATAARVQFDRGQVLDLIGEADAAFDAFTRANNLVETGISEDRAAERAAFLDAIGRDRAWLTPARLAGDGVVDPPPGPPERASGPVFLVGFPRSGTTLFEQILEAHPGLATTGERSPLAFLKRRLKEGGAYPVCLETASADDVGGWRRAFHDRAADAFGTRLEGKRLVDKNPLNILDIGLIGRVFPDARVVVSLRDPRDACLSCFMQQFQPNDAMSHFTSLRSTARLYAETMDLWLQARAHTRVEWLEYRYEDLVADFEGVTGRVLDFLGVEWDDAVLDYRDAAVGRDISTPSYQNVVEPLYTRAQARWRRYRAHMDDILPTLGPYVEAFGYEKD